MNSDQFKIYKIGDLTDVLGITHRTIRYYDQLTLLPNAKRSDGNTRIFDSYDIQTIKKIRNLQKDKKMSLESIKETMFPENLDSKTISIVTDPYSMKFLGLDPRLACIADLSPTASKSEQDNFIQHACEASNLLVCLFATELSSTYQTIFKKRQAGTTLLTPLNQTGLAPFLLSEYLLDNISSFYNWQLFEQKLHRMMALSFDIVLQQSLESSLNHNKHNSVSYSKEAVSSYMPLVLHSQSQQKVLGFEHKDRIQLKHIVDAFEAYFVEQKRYCEHMCLFYNQSDSVAAELHSYLLAENQNLTISMRACPLKEEQEQALWISVI